MKYIEVMQYSDSKIVKRMDVSDRSERFIERVLMGMLINGDQDRFNFAEVESDKELPCGDFNP